MGGMTDTWTTLATTTCRVAPDRAQDTETAQEGRLQAESRWILSFPAGQDVQPPDRVSALGNTYEVSGILAPRTVELERKVQAVLLQ
jgi:head-tail adaptor